MTSWTEQVVVWGFSLALTGMLLFLFVLAGVVVEVYLHPYAGIPVYVVGGIFAGSYLREMTKEHL